MGRPRKYGDRVTTAVRLPADLHEDLADAADERGVSINALVIRAIEDLLVALPAFRLGAALMGEPEVTREEAARARLVADCTHPEVRPDHHERDGAFVCVVCGALFAEPAEVVAMRECIDRLRDGWLCIPWLDDIGLVWVPGRVGLTDALYEPMTPEQVAVMARG